MLPVRCPEVDCRTVISATAIQDSPIIYPSPRIRRVSCPKCHGSFMHEPQFTQGDPRNIAYIGKVFAVQLVLFLHHQFNFMLCQVTGMAGNLSTIHLMVVVSH